MKNILLILAALVLASFSASDRALSAITQNDGKIGIGTPAPDDLLTVKGTIHAQEVKIDLKGALVPDYVFDVYFGPDPSVDYRRLTLKELAQYLDDHHHLPGVPSANEIDANGLYMSAFSLKLLEKIEELTLYVLEQQQQIDALEKQCENGQ
jgi:hypothetical protein